MKASNAERPVDRALRYDAYIGRGAFLRWKSDLRTESSARLSPDFIDRQSYGRVAYHLHSGSSSPARSLP
jgi:hypothetical protein